MLAKRFFPGASARAMHAPTRRNFIYSLGAGLGSVALTALLAGHAHAAEEAIPLAPRAGHFPAKAKNCVFLMMEGGPSHIREVAEETRRPLEERQANCDPPVKLLHV